jgi:Protein of unknown function (DUF1579)
MLFEDLIQLAFSFLGCYDSAQFPKVTYSILEFQEAFMRHFPTLVVPTLILVMGVTVTLAQNSSAPQPGPEVKELGRFSGKWTVLGDVKPGGMGAGGKSTGSESCEWASNGFALLCYETVVTPGMGEITDVGIMSYDANARNYVFFQVNNWGAIWTGRGTVNGDTWTWTSEDTIDGKTMQLRFTVKWTSQDSYEFKNEIGPNADSMAVMMDGKGRRLTASAAKPAKK